MNPAPALVLAIFTLLGCNNVQTASPHWTHSGHNGTSNWEYHYPTCGGSYQSPINILGGYHAEGPRPVYNYYSDVPTTMTLANTGHVLELSGISADGRIPHLKIKPPSGKTRTYELDHVHFHWGKVDSEGSDHTFQGRRYAMEMHAVHLRVEDGVPVVPNQIVALAYIFKISPNDNPAIAKFLVNIDDVRDPYTSTEVTPFPWIELITEFTSDFYVYKGSLTIPPCPEIVHFFISNRPSEVSSRQMAKFRTLLDVDKNDMSGNFRPIQSINDRNVYYVD